MCVCACVCVCVCVLCAVLSGFSRVYLFATLSTVAHQAPLSMGLSRQENRSGLSYPSPGHLPNPEMDPASLTSPGLAGGFVSVMYICT